MYCVGGSDGVQLWTHHGQTLLSIPGHQAKLVTVSPDGRYIVTGWADNSLTLHTPESGKLVETVRNSVTGGDGVTALGVAREVMVVGGGDGTVRLWTLPSFTNSKLIKTVG